MIYSKTCEYAIRALASFVGTDGQPRSATVKQISRKSNVPAAYVAKIFQCLVKSGILTSRRGPAGGYELIVAPDKLTLLRVVESLDDLSQSAFTNCVMGLARCDDVNPCPMHEVWSDAKTRVLERLARYTIFDISRLQARFRRRGGGRPRLSKKMREVFSVV